MVIPAVDLLRGENLTETVNLKASFGKPGAWMKILAMIVMDGFDIRMTEIWSRSLNLCHVMQMTWSQ